ncbi:nickel-dependent hydrogenase large subunit [Streptomyces sulfonofaciens]|uniref:nickel-dependent hydrogenase large subunit n=1 Tax=Streptomyces sulfonofaciens TaxID=68272 RepID=UPI001E56FD68|nr:nickel-dependent hydrogenase large subunit [Streptomyces sulfonofaciens]
MTDVAFDPITRIIGNLGIYTKIDFPAREVVECRSTSSLFRGYSVFMKGKDPRDAHFITSRICGICGDNHATCSLYAQQMAYGVKPPPLADWIINLGEAAEFMFDHTLFQDNLVFVDYCERMVKETNPGVLEQAERTPAPGADQHGFRTIADILRSFNPFEGRTYKEALQLSRLTREMCCLMEGRHVHPSTLYPGGVGTVATPQVFTDYLVRLMRAMDFVKRAVAMNDDVFDFWYEALPGYDQVGRRRTLLGCWGSFQDPDVVDYDYRHMNDWGNAMFVTPGIIVDNELVTTNLVDINLGMRILLGSSYYEDWTGEETYVDKDPLGNPVDKRHPWNQTTVPKPQKRDLDGGKYSWVMSPRWYDERTGDHLALDTGGGPLARLWSTALAGKVRTPYVRSTGQGIEIDLPKTPSSPEAHLRWSPPPFPNTLERNRARMYFVAYAAGMALYFVERALAEVRAGRTKVFEDFKVPKEAIGVGFHEAVRGVLSHHLVIRDRKIANYHPYPPTPWNASPRDHFGTPGPYEDAVQGMTIFEENGREDFKGIDIMRTVRSFDPCLPCGVHMYLGGGRTVTQSHAPTLGALA